MLAPRTPSTSNTDIPIGFGLTGEQVSNTPVSLPVWPDVCRSESAEKFGLRWKWKITTMRYALAHIDSSKPLRVLLVDDERALHVGDAPVAREFWGVRADKADRPQLDAHTAIPPVPLVLSRHRLKESTIQTPRVRQAYRALLTRYPPPR